MKYRLFVLLLIGLSCRAFAQKAYEMAHYRGKLQGKTIRLNLANGYIGASQIIISYNTKQKPRIFLPESGAAEARFILRNSGENTSDYFILFNAQEAYEILPADVKTEYHQGKQVIPVRFYLVK